MPSIKYKDNIIQQTVKQMKRTFPAGNVLPKMRRKDLPVVYWKKCFQKKSLNVTKIIISAWKF